MIALIALFSLLIFALSSIVYLIWRTRKDEGLQRYLDGRAIFNAEDILLQDERNIITKKHIEEQFPIFNLESEDTTDAVCIICLEDILPDSKCRRLQCHHAFHAECILQWWVHRPRASIKCPLCKQDQNVILDLEAPNPKASQPGLSSAELQHEALPQQSVISNCSSSAAAQNGDENETAMV